MKVLVGMCTFNEAHRIETTLRRFPAERAYDVSCVDDGSTDGTVDLIQRFPWVRLVRADRNHGAGWSLRQLHAMALAEGYDVFVSFAANGKDDPAQIPDVLAPIARDAADLVQGSRFLPGGGYTMPRHRTLGTKYLHPFLLWCATGRWMTETTNGFRAYRTALLRDTRVRLDQSWLDRYELEPYLLCQAIRLGYRVVEVPVTKHYPTGPGGYSKMRPFVDWWSIMRPLVFLALRIRR